MQWLYFYTKWYLHSYDLDIVAVLEVHFESRQSVLPKSFQNHTLIKMFMVLRVIKTHIEDVFRH